MSLELLPIDIIRCIAYCFKYGDDYRNFAFTCKTYFTALYGKARATNFRAHFDRFSKKPRLVFNIDGGYTLYVIFGGCRKIDPTPVDPKYFQILELGKNELDQYNYSNALVNDMFLIIMNGNTQLFTFNLFSTASTVHVSIYLDDERPIVFWCGNFNIESLLINQVKKIEKFDTNKPHMAAKLLENIMNKIPSNLIHPNLAERIMGAHVLVLESCKPGF